jgi:hypothetical protein
MISNAVKPRGHGLSPMSGSGLAGENEKAGLCNVLRVLLMVQDALADPQHHRSMTTHQQTKGGFVSIIGKSSQ